MTARRTCKTYIPHFNGRALSLSSLSPSLSLLFSLPLSVSIYLWRPSDTSACNSFYSPGCLWANLSTEQAPWHTSQVSLIVTQNFNPSEHWCLLYKPKIQTAGRSLEVTVVFCVETLPLFITPFVERDNLIIQSFVHDVPWGRWWEVCAFYLSVRIERYVFPMPLLEGLWGLCVC